MIDARDGQRTGGNSLAWSMPPVAGNPVLAVMADINGKWLESVANAQKDWAEFVLRRVKEDIAASHRLMNCQSLTDMQEIYSQYLQTVFAQCREHSERLVQRGKSMTEELAQSMESSAEGATQQALH
jgi:Phasin protein